MIKQDDLQDLFQYKDGHLYWKKNRSNVKAGQKAGNQREDGYIDVGLYGRLIREHRLVWIWHFGEAPEFLDHINGIRNDNRIENLRAATRQQNQQNLKKRKDNNSGAVGVNWHKKAKKWQASICIDKKSKYLGLFDCFDDAVLARKKAEQQFFKEFARNHDVQNNI